MKRKMLSILLAATMLVSLAACGGAKNSTSTGGTASSAKTASKESAAASNAGEEESVSNSSAGVEESVAESVNDNEAAESSSDTSASAAASVSLDFSGFDEIDFSWPDANAWASVGLPNLPYEYEASDIMVDTSGQTVYVHRHVDLDVSTEDEAAQEYAKLLEGAGIRGEWGKRGLNLYESYSAYYDFNGVPMFVEIGKDSTASIRIMVQANIE